VRSQLFDRINALERENAVFAIATVVSRQAPVSSHLGDHALVLADGHMEGFVGGSCSRDIVRRQALAAIANRQPLLLQIRNASSLADDDSGESEAKAPLDDLPSEGTVPATERVVIPMSCASEGEVDVYIEPRLPERTLLVIGCTPIAEALAQLATALDYAVVRVVVDDELRDVTNILGVRVLAVGALGEFLTNLSQSECEALVAIVASQGHYDELALQLLNTFDIGFLGLVASRRRAATVFGVLAQQGVGPDRIAMVRSPVGLDIGARTPGDVAVSILAEIIASAPQASARHESHAPATALDPVCGMDVDTASSLYRLEYDTRAYFFCCAGCLASFSAEPGRYLIAVGEA